jgi:hypothetical protein
MALGLRLGYTTVSAGMDKLLRPMGTKSGLRFPISRSGLLAEWLFTEGSGQVAHDSSGNANHMTLGSTPVVDVNDPAWIPNGLLFNGVSAGCVVNLSLAPYNAMTIESWMKINLSGNFVNYPKTLMYGYTNRTDCSITGQGGGKNIYYDIYFWDGSTGHSEGHEILCPLNVWWHYVVTINKLASGYSDAFYCNGVLLATINNINLVWTAPMQSPTQKLGFGCHNDFADNLPCTHGPTRVWTRALGADEVASLYNYTIALTGGAAA